MSKGKVAGRALLVGLVAAVLALGLMWVLHWQSLTVVAQWKQPATITYDGAGPFYLSVVETDLDWRGFPIHVERNYIIYVGRDESTPSHGHMVKFSFHNGYEDLREFLSKATVIWSADGVALELPSGHRLFVPKDMFTGGR